MLNSTNPKVLIVTLFSGENELDRCIESIKAQTHTNLNHEIIRSLPNREAHIACYSLMMNHKNDYSIFLKLDADMVFTSYDCISRIIDEFRSDPELDHLTYPVFDWASSKYISGLHAFSNRAIWQFQKEDLFVDSNPIIPGNNKNVTMLESPIVIHSPDPSLRQALIFGYHRALKIVQRGRTSWSKSSARTQLAFICDVCTTLIKVPDIRRAAILYGAEIAFKEHTRILVNKNALSFDKDLTKLLKIDSTGVITRYAANWTVGTIAYRLRSFRYLFLPLVGKKLKKGLRRLQIIFHAVPNRIQG